MFGAFISHPLKHHHAYYGNQDTFVFILEPTSCCKAFKSWNSIENDNFEHSQTDMDPLLIPSRKTESRHYYIYGGADYLSIGVGSDIGSKSTMLALDSRLGPALVINRNLQSGTSQPSKTFPNTSLHDIWWNKAYSSDSSSYGSADFQIDCVEVFTFCSKGEYS